MEGFGDVGRGILYDDLPILTFLAPAEVFLLFRHFFQQVSHKAGSVKKEVDIGIDCFHLGKEGVSLQLGRHIFGNHRGSFSKLLGQLKAGEGVIPHGFIGGDLDQIHGLRRGQNVDRLVDSLPDELFVFLHSSSPFFSSSSSVMTGIPNSVSKRAKIPSPSTMVPLKVPS